MGARDTLRDARAAPWQAAAPLALVVIAMICTGLVVADAGGWRQVSPGGSVTWASFEYGDDGFNSALDRFHTSQLGIRLAIDGALYLTVLGGLLVVAALAGLRWLSVALIAALSLVMAGWVVGEQHLSYLTVVFHEVPSGSDYDGELSTSITMSGVAGLLLFVGCLVALVWAITGTRQRRQTTKKAHAASRRPWRTSLLIGVAALAVTLVAPRAANELAQGANDLFGVTEDWYADGQQTICLLFVAMAFTYLGALLLPRRAPAAAVALVLVGAALWMPAVWMFGGMLPYIDGAAVLLMWAVTIVGGFAVSAWIVARASRAAGPDSGGGSGPAGAPTQPAQPGGASAAAASGT